MIEVSFKSYTKYTDILCMSYKKICVFILCLILTHGVFVSSQTLPSVRPNDEDSISNNGTFGNEAAREPNVVTDEGSDNTTDTKKNNSAELPVFDGAVERVSPDLLKITADDVRIKDSPDENGIYLYIRKTQYMRSVLLAESAELSDNSIATYSLRTYTYNKENGDEKRVLNGKFITTDDGEGYYIIDSTPVIDEDFGEAFVLFLPYEMHFGYHDTRRGAINLKNGGAYVSIRAFGAPYANYDGGYRDNSFYIKSQFVQDKPEAQEDSEGDNLSLYSESTLESFNFIAKNSGTERKLVSTDNSISNVIAQELSSVANNESLDLIMVLDTTRSMEDDIDTVKKELKDILSQIPTSILLRMGLVVYKDVNEDYVTDRTAFTHNISAFDKTISTITTGGGGDWEEEAYAALNVALNDFKWQAKNRKIFLISDAPAHNPSKVGIDIEKLYKKAADINVKIIPVVIPKP